MWLGETGTLRTQSANCKAVFLFFPLSPSSIFNRCNTPATQKGLHNRILQQIPPPPSWLSLHFHPFMHCSPPPPLTHPLPSNYISSSPSSHNSWGWARWFWYYFRDYAQTKEGRILLFCVFFLFFFLEQHTFKCVYLGHKQKMLC